MTSTHHTPLGCGGRFEPHACEKILPGLQYFSGPLNASEHTITVTNYVVPALNYSYFGEPLLPNRVFWTITDLVFVGS